MTRHAFLFEINAKHDKIIEFPLFRILFARA